MKFHQKIFRSGFVLALGVSAIATSMPALSVQSPSPYTSATRYNEKRQVTAQIQPWDGAQYQAIRNVYDSHGWLLRTEKGALSAWMDEMVEPANWAGFTIYQKTVYTYDSLGRKATQAAIATDGTTSSLTQYSYDDLNQVTCSAVRMNTAAYSSLPPDACTLGSQGIYGPDRISHFDYNDYGQITSEKRAYRTTIEQTYVINTYSSALGGLLTDQYDANGNRTHLEYDAQSRVTLRNFPTKIVANRGQYSTTDYEQYGYDLNGNRTSLRKRDNNTITYDHDNLNRVVAEINPVGTIANVYFGYDLRNLQVYARFGSSTGVGITNSYDGFGSLETSSTDQSGSSRTLSFKYDAEGHRTRVTHPDTQYFAYAYDGLNRLRTIKENGGTTLTTFDYDNQNRPQTLTRGANVASTTYGYDLSSQLSSLTQDMAGTAYDETRSFGRNPSNQISSRTLTNSVYSFTQTPTSTTTYVVNGLNQYTTLNAASPAHDDNGNMVWDGSTTYYYDLLNRMTGASGGKTVNLDYDPKGRLFQTSGGVSGTTQYLYDGDSLVAEYDGAGALMRRYVHGPNADQPLVSYTGALVGSANRQYFHADNQGSLIAVTDTNGGALQVNTYDSYGVPATGNTTRFQYTGQIMLPDLGLYHYKARVYNPGLGRFMQTDPVGYKDDLDLYTYVGNDPMDRTDPDGKIGVAGAVIGAGIDFTVQIGTNMANGQSVGEAVSNVDPVQVAASAALGAVGQVGGVSAAKSIVSGLTNKAKGALGEAVARVGIAIRRETVVASQTAAGKVPELVGIAGRAAKAVPDFVVKTADGAIKVVEAKFGTSTLTGAQSALKAQMGEAFTVARTTASEVANFAGNVAATIGGSITSAIDAAR